MISIMCFSLFTEVNFVGCLFLWIFLLQKWTDFIYGNISDKKLICSSFWVLRFNHCRLVALVSIKNHRVVNLAVFFEKIFACSKNFIISFQIIHFFIGQLCASPSSSNCFGIRNCDIHPLINLLPQKLEIKLFVWIEILFHNMNYQR